MDKQSLIASIAESPEDRLLLAKIYDKISAGDRKNIPASTCFLSGREQLIAQRLIQKMGVLNTSFFGGTEAAERRVLCYIPDYYEPDQYLYEEDGPVAALRAEISDYDTLTHRDFLGGILAQGIKREVLGDIFVSKEHCDFLCMREMAPYLLEHLCSIGRAKVRLSELPLRQLEVPEQKMKVIRDTVSTLRLDSIMASGFQMGRSKAQTFISAGKVEVNHGPVTKSDRMVGEGDVISCRGLGKMVVFQVNGQTKKGRTSVVLQKYL